MSRAYIVLSDDSDRALAVQWVRTFPAGTRVEFKRARRTLPQNDRFWAMLTDVARQLPWHGHKLRPDDWRDLFLDAFHREQQTVPNLDGNGFVRLGNSSSDLSKDEMSDLMELIAAFGARHGVVFNDPSSDPTPALGEEAAPESGGDASDSGNHSSPARAEHMDGGERDQGGGTAVRSRQFEGAR